MSSWVGPIPPDVITWVNLEENVAISWEMTSRSSPTTDIWKVIFLRKERKKFLLIHDMLLICNFTRWLGERIFFSFFFFFFFAQSMHWIFYVRFLLWFILKHFFYLKWLSQKSMKIALEMEDMDQRSYNLVKCVCFFFFFFSFCFLFCFFGFFCQLWDQKVGVFRFLLIMNTNKIHV